MNSLEQSLQRVALGVRLVFHERFLEALRISSALTMEALLEMRLFNRTNFDECPLLHPQRCCQGHG
jgi:hypothetical protein